MLKIDMTLEKKHMKFVEFCSIFHAKVPSMVPILGSLKSSPARRAPQGRNCSCKYARKTPHDDGNSE